MQGTKAESSTRLTDVSRDVVDPNRLFGPPPLLRGEDPAEYNELQASIIAAVNPADMLERIWVRDIVDLVWEAFRLRRLKANLLCSSASQGIERILSRTNIIGKNSSYVAKEWEVQNRETVRFVNQILEAAGHTMDAVLAESLCARLSDIERIDRLIMSAEMRRNAVFREIDRHRATLGERLRRAAYNAEESRLKVIEGDSGKRQ